MKLLRATLRSFAVQSAWNFERMVGVGIAFISIPLLQSMPGGPDELGRKAALGRAAAFFNTHPYFAGLAAAALAKAEVEGQTSEAIERFRGAVVGPLGSIGDRLIWFGLLPVSSAIAIVVAVLRSPVEALLTFLILYNAVHLFLRFWGVRVGWKMGIRVTEVFSRGVFRTMLRLAGPLAGVTMGIAIPLAAESLMAGWRPADMAGASLVGVVGVILIGRVFQQMDGLRFGLLMLGLTLTVGIAVL